jgi:osmotically-inducible protein OsmY
MGKQMRQEMAQRRKPFSNLLPLAAGAMLSGVLLTACERPSVESSARPVERASSDIRPAAPVQAEQPQQAAAPAPLPPREALTDTSITGKIKSAIASDPGMAGADVSVNTDRGVVMLAGVVKNTEQTAIASAHAQRQDGVMRVDNHLAVPPT